MNKRKIRKGAPVYTIIKINNEYRIVTHTVKYYIEYSDQAIVAININDNTKIIKIEEFKENFYLCRKKAERIKRKLEKKKDKFTFCKFWYNINKKK